MLKKPGRRSVGFTLIELAVALGILSILSLVVAVLMMRTVDTYAQVASDTDTMKQARQCLDTISREMREGVDGSIVNPINGGLLNNVQDALLITSARSSSGVFTLDASGFPQNKSIILFYLHRTPENITQLIRHQLYYDEDLSTYAEDFRLLPGNPYVGQFLVILDDNNVAINIDRATGAVVGTPSLKPPKVLMTRVTSFDMIVVSGDPIEARITCQVRDRYGRTATSRVRTQIEPRNLELP
jgi:prepilin-type N-terminal cleavage/methylation domain-containing protein